MPTRPSYTPLAVLPALACLVAAASAHGQPVPAATKVEATREHAACRVLEKESSADGRTCFRIWLGRYAKIASPAEVAIATRHAEDVAPPAAASARPTSSPQVPVPSAPPVASTPSATSSAASPPKSAPSANGKDDGDVTEKPAPENEGDAPSKARPAKTGAQLPAGGVLDLCALAPAKGGVTFVKQRVVLLALAGLDRAVQDAAAREAGGAELVKQVFLARFPLKRFHNVVSETPGLAAWADRGSLTLDEVRRALEDDDASAFVGYSAGCSDYLAVPVVSKVDVVRKPVKVKDKQGRERTVEQLTVSATATLSLFRRTETGFVLHARLGASVPSAADVISDFGSQTFAAVESGTSQALGPLGTEVVASAARLATQPVHISALPDPTCAIPARARDSVAGLASCPKQGVGATWLAVEAVDERLGAACKAAAEHPESKEKVLVCELRVRAFQLSRALQKAARGVEGWSLFDVLLRGSHADPQGVGMALGESEGVGVGHAFQVRDKAGERIAFLKVTEVGPGGEAGRRHRTDLALRSGEAPVGSRVEEYPQLGVALWAYGGGGLLAGSAGATPIQGRYSYQLPKSLGGGGLLAGYDLSSFVGLTETYARAGASVVQGVGTGVKLTTVTVDALFEKGVYLGPRLSAFAGIGASFLIASAKLTATDVTRETTLSSTVLGPLGALGFDVMITPEVSFRAALLARAPLTRGTWKEDEEDAAPAAGTPTDVRKSAQPEWSQRTDHLLTVQGTGGLAVLF